MNGFIRIHLITHTKNVQRMLKCSKCIDKWLWIVNIGRAIILWIQQFKTMRHTFWQTSAIVDEQLIQYIIFVWFIMLQPT